MIGGVDIVIQTPHPEAAIATAGRRLRLLLPDSVFEDAETGRSCAMPDGSVTGPPRELFVYRSADCAARWDEEGLVPSLENSMVHLIRGDGELTVVVDDPEQPDIASFLASLRSDINEEASHP